MSLAVDVLGLLGALGIVFSRRGPELWAPCPFHEERTASWHLVDRIGHEKHGFHHCFGCKTSGGPVALVRSALGLESGREAYRWMVERGLVLGQDAQLPGEVRIDLRGGCAGPRHFLIPPGVLFESPEGWPSTARSYLASRSITSAQVDRWGVGWGLEGRLAGRLVFPVADPAGMLRSYTARSFVGDGRRYLMPGRDEGPDPSAIFGERWWPPRGARGTMVVLEGAINGLAVERVTEVPIGALNGSEVHPGQMSKLSTFKSVLVLSDPDRAGDGMWERLRASLSRWVRVRRLPLPPGQDPDSLGPASLRGIILAGISEIS